ncbi:MAG: DUF1491 family protein [Mangrovicoccus sp.]
MSARLAAGLWVAAYRMRLGAEHIPCYISSKGDETAGDIAVKLCTLDGEARIFRRQYDLMTGLRAWAQTDHGPEPEIDALLTRETERDRDLWVIEVESREGRHLLDDPSLADG